VALTKRTDSPCSTPARRGAETWGRPPSPLIVAELPCRLLAGAVPARESRDARRPCEQQTAVRIEDWPREKQPLAWQDRTSKTEAVLCRSLAELGRFSAGEK
jgi:hypothetical protein